MNLTTTFFQSGLNALCHDTEFSIIYNKVTKKRKNKTQSRTRHWNIFIFTTICGISLTII